MFLLENERPIPLEELLVAEQADFDALSQHRAGIFYAQSWVLIHYMMLGDRSGELRNRITPYLQYLREGVPAVEAFERAFGELQDMETEIRRYLNRFQFQALRVDKPAGIEDDDHTALPLTADQYHALRAGFFVHTGASEEARAEIERALELNADNAAALEALGLIQLQSGAQEDAVASFERAAALNGALYLPRYYLAILELPTVADQEGFERVRANLERAVQLNPFHAPSQARLATLYVSAGEQIELALALARQAAYRSRDDPFAHYAHGLAAKANGAFSEARAALELAARLAPGFEAARVELDELDRIDQNPMSGVWAFQNFAYWISIDVDGSAIRCRGGTGGLEQDAGIVGDTTVTWRQTAADGTVAELEEEISLSGVELVLQTQQGELRLRRISDLPEGCAAGRD